MAGRPLRRLREALNNNGTQTKYEELRAHYRRLPLSMIQQDRTLYYTACKRHLAQIDINCDLDKIESFRKCVDHYLAALEAMCNREKYYYNDDQKK